MPSPATIELLADWLKQRDEFAVFGHVMPDGDAVGSCMALCLALRGMGKRAMVCLPNPVPTMYAGYPCANEALTPGMLLPFIPQTAVSLDVSELERLGDARAMFQGCPEQAMLDHHGTNPGFGDVWHVDGGRIATGELVLELIEAMGAPLTQAVATWLYIAISTDSGHFSFEGTSASTMRAAARLVEAGADVPRLTRALYHTRSKGGTRLLGLVLAGLEVSDDGRMAWSRMTGDMLTASGALREDKEGVVNYLLEIAGVEAAVLAEERENGTKFSLRSKEWLDVAADVARPFGGGGHARAAGCTLELPVDAALERVLAQVRLALEKEN